MDFITLIIVILVSLLCGVISVLFLIRKYLTASNDQIRFQNQADIRFFTHDITNDQTLDGEQRGEPNREIVCRMIGSKKLKNIEKKKKKNEAIEAIIDFQNRKKIQHIRQKEEKCKEDLEIKSNLDAEIRKRKIIEELKYKEQANEIVITSEGIESNQSETLLERILSYTTTNKFIALDDLAAFTNLKSKTVALWLNRMVEMGKIDGVLDDRGRFIQVTRDELNNLAIFIKLRGRTKITEILATSNKLFQLKEE